MGRLLSAAVTVLFLLTPSIAAAQAAAHLPKIGFIVSYGDSSSPLLVAFKAGLQELGYIDGKNIIIEKRYAQGRIDRMAPFVQELVDAKVDVIIGNSDVIVRSARQATKSIPIVVISSIDPVEAGYVESFGQPGGNITGLAWLLRDVSEKRIELFKELLPKMTKLAVLWDVLGPGPAVALKEYQRAAQNFKLQLQSIEMRGSNFDLPELLRSVKNGSADGLVVVANPLTAQLSKTIFANAAKYRLPTMTEERRYVEAGGLISYGANAAELYRRAAVFVDKILKGAQPADLPIEEPKKFELMVNHKTAKQIGIAIPPSILAMADR